MAYKVFTNGSVLNASEINDNLMRQSVMVFSNAAARTAAITSPVEGMLTWLEDLNRYESYNGSAWVRPFDISLINSTNFTAATSVIIANCFSSEFVNYFVQIFQTGGGNNRLQLRTGATTLASGYSGSVVYGTGGSALSTTRSSLFFESFGDNFSGYLYRPFLTTGKGFNAMAASGGTTIGIDAGINASTTSYESLVASWGSAATGTISIYGIRR